MSSVTINISDTYASIIVGTLIIYLTGYLQVAVYHSNMYIAMPLITLIIILSAIYGSINIGFMNIHINNPNYVCPYYYHYHSQSNMYPEDEVEECDKEQAYEDETLDEDDDEDERSEEVTELKLDSTDLEENDVISNEEMRKIAVDKLRKWADNLNAKNLEAKAQSEETTQ